MKTTERFSDRVANYVKYRPGYPQAMTERLFADGILKAGNSVADIGSGTGLSAEVFLKENCEVFGIEPNREMREAGEEFLKTYSSFHSIEATAEATTLKDNSVDLVVAGQAFHWFDQQA